MTRLLNNFKTTLLLAGMFGLFLAIGSSFGERGLIMALIFGGLTNLIAFFFSDKIALYAMSAQEVDARSNPAFYGMIQRLSERAGLPMPRVYICPQSAPNAFATGRSPRKAAVAITQGALELLTPAEVEGVMAHELAHVKNRDTLISCVAAMLAGAISALGHWMFYFGGAGRDREGGGGIGLVGSLLLIILAPVAAALIQMAISRSREFVADHDGALIAGSPRGLASALRKLHAYSHRIPLEGSSPATSHMYIVQPLSGETLASLFSTHPSMEARLAKLEAMDRA